MPGEPPANTVTEAKAYFGDTVDFYVDGGNLGGRMPSTLIRIVDDAIEVVRQGYDLDNLDNLLLIESPYYVVYNRHIREGLLSPDDRDMPRINSKVGKGSLFTLVLPLSESAHA